MPLMSTLSDMLSPGHPLEAAAPSAGLLIALVVERVATLPSIRDDRYNCKLGLGC
jgi:hypothetical protein